MDRQQTMMVLSVLKAAYPHAFKDMTKKDGEAMILLWCTMFAEESYEEVNAAIGALIATRTAGYSPTVGEVKEQIRRLHSHNEIDESSAWALVSNACRNGSYHSVEEFNKLPPEVQEVVGAPEQLKQWAMMDAEVVQSVIASNFKKAFRVQAERTKEIAKLPPNIRQMITGATANIKFIETIDEINTLKDGGENHYGK